MFIDKQDIIYKYICKVATNLQVRLAQLVEREVKVTNLRQFLCSNPARANFLFFYFYELPIFLD